MTEILAIAWEKNIKHNALIVGAVLLLTVLLFALPAVAMADSTPLRDMAVVTPADDDETEFSADDSLVKPVDEDEDENVADSTDSSNEQSDNQNDVNDESKDDKSEDSENNEENSDSEDDDQAEPDLPQSLNIQFYEASSGKQVWQTVTPVSLTLSGSRLKSDVPAMATAGRTLVPVRIISENLSATVDWHKEDNTVTIKSGSDEIVLTIGKNVATVNGSEVAVPDNVSVALVNYDGIARTMVPVRFVSENLHATVNYDSAAKNVDIIPPQESADNSGDTEEETPLGPPGVDENGNLYRRVIIDAGHGGEDPGTNGGGWEEKVITLAVAQKVQTLLQEADFEVIMSREDDTFIALGDRAALTRTEDAPVFVSIHCNAAENIASANGIETYAAPNDEDDLELAEYLQKQLIAATSAKDRGVKTSRLVVLTKNEAPAALVEIGFMTNTAECAKITDESYQDVLAQAIADGIADYFAAH